MGSARAVRSVLVENNELTVTIALDRGADLVALTHRRRNLDVLSKARRRTEPELPDDSLAEWRRNYPGGWQTILPNFGPEHIYRGRRMDLHGDAARLAWRLDDLTSTDELGAVSVSTQLRTLPLEARRTVAIHGDAPVVHIEETICNVGHEALECMWGQHPAFGPPFLSERCVIDTGAGAVDPDPDTATDGNDLAVGRTRWPHAPRWAGTSSTCRTFRLRPKDEPES